MGLKLWDKYMWDLIKRMGGMINGTAERGGGVSHIKPYLLYIRSSVALISSLPSGDVNTN
jgi:hypothetical protein